MTDDLGRWEPLPVEALPALLGGLRAPWWVAGGWAIDLHLGRVTRAHEDTDVLVLRQDLPAVREVLADWDVQAADPPGTLRPWPAGETLPPPVHDIWCRRDPRAPWSLQRMVDDATDDVWSYRRDPRITRPVPSLDGPASDDARRVLAPEVQLLAKSKSPRPKDEADLRATLPALDATARRWLAEALRVTDPGHPWLALV